MLGCWRNQGSRHLSRSGPRQARPLASCGKLRTAAAPSNGRLFPPRGAALYAPRPEDHGTGADHRGRGRSAANLPRREALQPHWAVPRRVPLGRALWRPRPAEAGRLGCGRSQGHRLGSRRPSRDDVPCRPRRSRSQVVRTNVPCQASAFGLGLERSRRATISQVAPCLPCKGLANGARRGAWCFAMTNHDRPSVRVAEGLTAVSSRIAHARGRAPGHLQGRPAAASRGDQTRARGSGPWPRVQSREMRPCRSKQLGRKGPATPALGRRATRRRPTTRGGPGHRSPALRFPRGNT